MRVIDHRRCRWSLVSADVDADHRRPRRLAAVANASTAGSSARHGPHQRGPQVDHRWTRSAWSSRTESAAVEAVERRPRAGPGAGRLRRRRRRWPRRRSRRGRCPPAGRRRRDDSRPARRRCDTPPPCAHASTGAARASNLTSSIPARAASSRHARALQQLHRHLRVGRADAVRRAHLRQRARAARGLLGVADPPAVEDHPMRQHRPVPRSISAPTACSTLTGSRSVVHAQRRTSRSKCVSTVMPGTPNALPSTTLAVLRPTPGSVTRSVHLARHLAVEPLHQRVAETDQRTWSCSGRSRSA